jgi:hypothetical protein
MFKITSLTKETQKILAIRLCGGFESNKNHTPAIDALRFKEKQKLESLADFVEAGCSDSRRELEI